MVEERGRRVGKRIRFQHAQRQLLDAVQLTPQRRLDQQKRVSARQIDGVVGSRAVGRVAAGHAPMVLVQIGQGQIEEHQLVEPRRREGFEPSPYRPQLLRLPSQLGPHVERPDPASFVQQRPQQDRAVQPAAEQHAGRGSDTLDGHGVSQEARIGRAGSSGRHVTGTETLTWAMHHGGVAAEASCLGSRFHRLEACGTDSVHGPG